MKILFWNLMKNELSKIASELVTSYGIDIALFAEY